jgi:phosphohistidine phosphatase
MVSRMRLYVMRHGPAEDQAASGRDEDRALTTSGRERVRGVARLLASEAELPTRILTSRLVRATETAEIVSVAQMKAGVDVPLETVKNLSPGGDNMALVQQLKAEGSRSAMVVGHEPDLSTLVDELLEAPMPASMDKGMVVALELGEAVTLRFILDPRTLAILHDRR